MTKRVFSALCMCGPLNEMVVKCVLCGSEVGGEVDAVRVASGDESEEAERSEGSEPT